MQLIYDRVGNPASGIIAEVEAVLVADPRWHLFQRTGGSVDFVPNEWMQWLPNWGLDYKAEPKSWLIVRVEAFETRLTQLAEVRRMMDQEKRREIVEALLAAGPTLGLGREAKSVKVKGLYTRVSSRKQLLAWAEDEEPDAAAIRMAVANRLDELHPKLLGVRSVVQKWL